MTHARPLARLALPVLVVAAGLAVTTVAAGAPPAAAAVTVPAGFTASNVASPVGPTSIAPLPDGRTLVLEQGGRVRVLHGTDLLPAPALTLAIGGCNGGERGLLGAAVDPAFATNGYVYLYFTRPASAPGGCVNGVSRFTMTGDAIDPASEVTLLDGISSNNGNHNGGDIEIGPDGDLYVGVGDAGRDPRGDSGSAGANDAAQDVSLLNGKVLRIDPTTGEGAPGNPFVGQGGVSCRVRGNLPTTPTTPCNEIYASGLRNPWRIPFDPNTGRFFINDVGQGTREEVDLGTLGANYGWNAREGQCPQGKNPPCAGPPAGLTDPLTDYGHTGARDVITAGAFVPNGVWPAQYDGGYLFADGGSGEIWLRKADGSVDYDHPFATGAQGIADMRFVREGTAWSLWYTIAGSSSGSLRRIALTPASPPPSTALAYVAVAPQRLLDTRDATSAAGPIRAGTTRYLVTGVDPAVTKAVLVNVAEVDSSADGYLTLWAGRAGQPTTANVNVPAGEAVSNMAIVPVDASGGILIYSYATAHVVIDLRGRFDTTAGAVAAGRFTAVDPLRLADTRDPADATTNRYSRIDGSPVSRVRVPVLGRAGVPAAGVAAVVVVVTAIQGPTPGGGYVTATASGDPLPLSANVNTSAPGDIRPNTAIVPVGADGAIDLHLFQERDVVVDVSGWISNGSAPASTSGLFVSLAPTREVDSRIGLGFARIAAGTSRSANPASIPDTATALAQNLAIVGNDGPGFVTPYPGGTLPVVAAGNVTAANQIRSILAFTKLAPGGSESYYAMMGTDLVVDVTGYFQP